ncbi:MAG: TRAP transporter large permease [Aurantimonas coralicida]|jgi:tripartite ATP-independent transporter DctM subunit|uniref:TRAP transporter large permease protein n=1 Tax=Aurantimonas coralicida TaxID=182270 RepID=A0A0P0YYD8_9HYPH|nr:TRAP transporter large permease [Aurantimonas coralicida]BAT26632.1 TRAP-type C4-dicarboxylate transporter, large permease component [Aurantimonas coralicida]
MSSFAILGGFALSFLLGWPVVLAILIPSVLYVLLGNIPIELIGQRMSYALDSFPLVAVPIFIFVGNLMNQAGITERIFKFADTLVGRVPGGLGQVNVVSSLIFSGMSGAALADVGGLGKIEVKAMAERGFDRGFAGALTGASAVVGPIFPPSIPLIIYGSVTSVSIVQLLLAGIIPAVMCVILLMITVAILAYRNDFPRSERWPTLRQLGADFVPALPALMTPVLLVAGMLLGYFTPTEAAAVTVVYVLLISGLVYRTLTVEHLLSSAYETVKSSSAILIIVAAASIFGWILAIEQIPQMAARWLLTVSTDPLMLLLVVNVLLLIVGMFLDSTTATLLVVPIIAQPLHMAGVDPVHLGIVTIFNLMLGLLTPPMGLALFLLSDITRVSMRQILIKMMPLYVPLVLTLVILTVFPEVSLWLPKMIRN